MHLTCMSFSKKTYMTLLSKSKEKQHFCISDTALAWFSGYLHDRKQFVNIDHS